MTIFEAFQAEKRANQANANEKEVIELYADNLVFILSTGKVDLQASKAKHKRPWLSSDSILCYRIILYLEKRSNTTT